MEFAVNNNAGGGDKTEWAAIPPNVYNAEIVWVRFEKTDRIKHDWKKTDWELNFQFKLLDGEFKNRRFFASPPLFEEGLSSKHKASQYLAAAMGVPTLPPEFVLNEETLGLLTGLPVRIRINSKFSEKHDKYFNNVEEVKPAVAITSAEVYASGGTSAPQFGVAQATPQLPVPPVVEYESF